MPKPAPVPSCPTTRASTPATVRNESVTKKMEPQGSGFAFYSPAKSFQRYCLIPSPKKEDEKGASSIEASPTRATEEHPVDDDVVMEDTDHYQNIHGDPVFSSPFAESIGELCLNSESDVKKKPSSDKSKVTGSSVRKVKKMIDGWDEPAKNETKYRTPELNRVVDRMFSIQQFMEKKAKEILASDPNLGEIIDKPNATSEASVFKRVDSTAQSDHIGAHNVRNIAPQSDHMRALNVRNSAAQSDPIMKAPNSCEIHPEVVLAAEENIASQSADRMSALSFRISAGQKGSFWDEVVRETQKRRASSPFVEGVDTKVVNEATVEEYISEEDPDDDEFNFDELDVDIVNKAAVEEEEEEVIEEEVIEDEVIEDEDIEEEVIEDEDIVDEDIEDEIIEEDEVIDDEVIEDEIIEEDVCDPESEEEVVEETDDVIGNILDLSSPYSLKHSSPLTSDGAEERARRMSNNIFKEAAIKKSKKRSFDEYSDNSESLTAELNASPPSKRTPAVNNEVEDMDAADEIEEEAAAKMASSAELNALPRILAVNNEDNDMDAADEIEEEAAAKKASTLEPEETGACGILHVDQSAAQVDPDQQSVASTTSSSRRYPARSNRGKKGVGRLTGK